MSNSKPLPSRCSKRSSRSRKRPPKRLSLRRLPFAPLLRWLTSVKSMTNAPRLRDAVAAEVAVAAEKAATVASMVSAVEAAVVVVVAAEAVTSMVNAVVAVVAVAVAVVVIADQETTTAKMAKFKEDVDVVAPMAITGIAEVAMVTSIAVKVEEAVVIAVSVIVVIVVLALKEKAVAKVAAEETEETPTNAMDISKVTDKMAPAVDVVETARVATREVAGVTRAVKKARSHPPKRAREPLTLQRKKRRRRLLAESPSPNLSKRRKKLASPLMTTWPRSRLTQRDSLPKRQT